MRLKEISTYSISISYVDETEDQTILVEAKFPLEVLALVNEWIKINGYGDIKQVNISFINKYINLLSK